MLALRQTNLKRLLAYSSIANFGYLAVRAGAARPRWRCARPACSSWRYLVTSLGVFGVMTVVSSPMGRRDHEDLDEYRGLFWHRPYLAAILIAMLLSLAGIPLTAGLHRQARRHRRRRQAAQWWLVGGVALASAIGMFYYLRVINTLLTTAEPGSARALDGLDLAGSARWSCWRYDRDHLARRSPQPLFLIGRNLVFP